MLTTGFLVGLTGSVLGAYLVLMFAQFVWLLVVNSKSPVESEGGSSPEEIQINDETWDLTDEELEEAFRISKLKGQHHERKVQTS